MDKLDPIVKLENVSVNFDQEEILKDISLTVYPRDVISIIGPNGSGKSTLLRTIIGILKPTKGNITILPNLKIGYLPQRFAVDKYLPMTVGEFLQLKPNVTKKQIQKALSEIKLNQEFLVKPLASLSSGQLQKVLITWVITDMPDLLLFDEPTENIDVTGQESIYELLHKLHEDLKLAIILVSHDLNIVYKYTHKVVCLNKKIFCIGPPKSTLSTKNLEILYGEHALFKHQHN